MLERLDAAQIANARMNDMHEVWAHPQLAARNRWTEVQTQRRAGAGAAAARHTVDARMDAVPALGEHTDAILAELGYSSSEIGALRDAKAV